VCTLYKTPVCDTSDLLQRINDTHGKHVTKHRSSWSIEKAITCTRESKRTSLWTSAKLKPALFRANTLYNRLFSEPPIKPGTHWRQSWIQHGRLCWKSTVAETGNKSATKSTVADTVDFVTGFANKSATTWIRQLVAVDLVADRVDFVASVYGAKATRLILSTFNKVDRVEFNFVAGQCVPGFIKTVYRGKHVSRPFHRSYLKANKISKIVEIRTVEYAYHF